MQILGSKIQKLGLGVFVVALLAAVIAIIGKAGGARSAEETNLQEQPQTVAQEAGSQEPVVLPIFDTTGAITTTALTRIVDIDTNIPARPRTTVITYTVEAGDNLFAIADKYGLDPETLLWGNYEVLRDNPQFLKPGQVLNILPTNGVYYEVPEGETLDYIAQFFKVDKEAIIEYRGNHLSDDLTNPVTSTVAAGTWLIIPGGKRELKDWGPPAITRANPAAAAYYGSGYCGMIYEGAVGTGTFIWPTVSKTLSGYDYRPPIHNGIDIGGSLGNAIYAVDSGVVVFAGWSEYGYGNLLVIDHGNGWQSAYAHLSAFNVGCGDSVYQGQMVAALGSTGNSTGPHLHFELRSEIYGKVNPWEFLSY